jgi:hypothetical protein
VVSLVVVILWMRWNHLSLLWATLFVLTTTLLTVGLMRIVAEGGIYWFQAHTSFFHIYRAFGVGKLLPPVLVGPLLPIYWTLFLDVKTFMAPTLLNAAEMRREAGAGRAKFHLNIVLCILVTVVFSLGFAIYLAHIRGGQKMEDWFYNTGLKDYLLDFSYRVSTSEPALEPTTASWYGLGAVWTVVSILARRTLFWFPHPIGYVMLINPLTAQIWFSFFIGWACKRVVVKYGGKATFDKVRAAFIGLIMGELMAVALWSIVSVVIDKRIPITLNVYD